MNLFLKPYQLIGDSQNLIILSDNEATILENSFVKRLDLSIHHDFVNIQNFGDCYQHRIPTHKIIDANFSISASSIKRLENFQLLELDIFKQLSVQELLSLIEKKLESREKER